MRAALLVEFGSDLRVEEIPRPTAGKGQVLVRVEACGVCHSDLHLARGHWERFKQQMQLPRVLGHEVAGKVVEIGPGVKNLQEGQPVGVAWFHHTCGSCHYCNRDLEVFCHEPAVTGVDVNGGLAEYLVAWSSHVIPIPDGVPLKSAAPLFCAGGTVYSALQKVNLKSAHLGIWGVGGLGHLALELGRIGGARITVVDVNPEKLALAEDLGADTVILASEASGWFEDLKNKVDVALVAATSIEAYSSALQGLHKNGSLLAVGLPSDPLPWTAPDLVRSGIRIIPSRVSSREELRRLLSLAANRQIEARVNSYPLEQINHVLSELEEGRISGRAVIAFEE
ncbi:MAG: alcohol dehydrogenase catalytic domain-containing protein [Acidobacteriota bacterium]